MTMSRDSWMERVCIQYSNMSSCIWGDVQWFFYSPVASVVFGSWYDHMNNWWMKKQTHAKLHFMFYEDLIEVTSWLFGLLLLYVLALLRSACWLCTRLLWRVLPLFSQCASRTQGGKSTNSAVSLVCLLLQRRWKWSSTKWSLRTWKQMTRSTINPSKDWISKFLLSSLQLTVILYIMCQVKIQSLPLKN